MSTNCAIVSRVFLAVLAPAIAASISVACAADRHTFPGDDWTVVASPEELGWSVEKLDAAEAYASTIKTAAVMVIQHGVVVRQWGYVDRLYPCHSIRKSLLSGLYGVYVGNGVIHMSKTIAELGIDDKQGLTDAEKQATIRDLITARSGIYHPAAYSPQSMADGLPARGSHAPNTFWYYNNWDFNALGTIFQQLTKTDIYEEFGNQFAAPLGMQDYKTDAHKYVFEESSVHPAYTFRMSARDLARFALLYCRGGRWVDKQLVSEVWVRECVTPHSLHPGGGYGYMWWTTDPDADLLFGSPTEIGAYAMAGSNGHLVVVMPGADIVIVHRVNTSAGLNRVTNEELRLLVDLILEARPR